MQLRQRQLGTIASTFKLACMRLHAIGYSLI